MAHEIIAEYLAAKKRLSLAQDEERAARAKVVFQFWQDATPGKTQTVKVDSSTKVAFSFPINYSVDEDELSMLDLSVEEMQAVKTKVAIVTAAFKKLPPDSALRRAVTEKPGSIQVKVTTK